MSTKERRELNEILSATMDSRRARRNSLRRRRPASVWAVSFLAFAFLSGLTWYYLREPVQPIGETTPTPSTGTYVLKLNGAITPSSAGALMAISDGLFQREGLSVLLQPGTDDADVTSAVAADEHIIGVASAQGFLKARAEGLPIVAFAASYVLSSVEFFALSNARLLGPADLEGRRIGYRSGLEIPTILYAFIAKNSISQSGLKIVESDSAVSDLLNGRIDVLIGHRDVEGRILENSNVPYRSLSPDSFGRAFSSPGNLEKFFIAIANGWNAAYSDYDRSIPIIARAMDDEPHSVHLSRFMDAQRRFLRPSGARLGELDPRRLKILEGQLLQQRIIREPVDLSRAVNYDILTEVYRAKSDIFSRINP